uniref:Uncharacterized protein n=1 Tax=Desertifilum tharense IPPAS B-1220 TaxID=1781255 RepID=A0ACD5GS52_9CYAN
MGKKGVGSWELGVGEEEDGGMGGLTGVGLLPRAILLGFQPLFS